MECVLFPCAGNSCRSHMAEAGIDITSQSSGQLGKYDGQKFDYVITLCGEANRKCPLFMGGVKRIHMGFDDPPKTTGSNKEILDAYRRVRDEIREKSGMFF